MTSVGLESCLICAVAVALISVLSSSLYGREPAIPTAFMAVSSFAPGFIYALFSVNGVRWNGMWVFFSLLLLKNAVYCFAFFNRYEALRKFGAFRGALVVGAQPPLILILSALFLKEPVNIYRICSVILVSLAIILLGGPAAKDTESRLSILDWMKWLVLPSFASAGIFILDRYFLKGTVSPDLYFTYDRVALMIILALGALASRLRRSKANAMDWQKIIARNWAVLLTIGALFTLSVYAYNRALSLEDATTVSLFRNAAYPSAALLGAWVFQRRLVRQDVLSAFLVLVSVPLGLL